MRLGALVIAGRRREYKKRKCRSSCLVNSSVVAGARPHCWRTPGLLRCPPALALRALGLLKCPSGWAGEVSPWLGSGAARAPRELAVQF
ncbi:hypothetical protein NQZ68_033664 [Dissostichus eleginoides]|nr:hypothetical protein NQZ68_033664 [Dissostichus eleginoides]